MPDQYKRCRTCVRDLPTLAFSKAIKAYRDGWDIDCRSCRKAQVAERRVRARAFVAEVNARTFCAHCGAQPVEWHNPEHVELNRPHYRISHLVSVGSTPRAIQKEMDRCTPLCRRCHMREDGRFANFVAHRRVSPIKPPAPCTACERLYKPLRKGLCNTCYLRQKNHPEPGYVAPKYLGYKLTGQEVDEIRRYHRKGYAVTRELARVYAVNRTTIQRIASGRRYPNR